MREELVLMQLCKHFHMNNLILCGTRNFQISFQSVFGTTELEVGIFKCKNQLYADFTEKRPFFSCNQIHLSETVDRDSFIDKIAEISVGRKNKFNKDKFQVKETSSIKSDTREGALGGIGPKGQSRY
ncbi:hypothetical protein FRX31_032009 [Thalictrum thalictroides]|uniref:Uncharacterized protein n=1 Tax=Thalictrum thalictroides TaxID=46969 RepID=A0A7J6V0Q8_THATH|nr:hypothetical protein FRX31_032009 [Thalictrum thalictroides]